MDINSIFSTEERVKILSNTIHKDGAISVSQVAKDSKTSKSLVSRYLDMLVSQRVLTRRARKFHVRDNNNVKALRLLLALDGLDERLFNRYDFIKAVGLYGSCAKGENTEDSDIDLWVKVAKTSQEQLALLNSRLKKKFPNIKLLVLTQDKIDSLKKTDPLFYHALYFGSIFIYGEDGL